MKMALIVTTSESVITFRQGLIKHLKPKENIITVIAQDDICKEEIKSLGVQFHCVKQDNRGLNPISIFRYQKKITQILKEEYPDIVFTFQLKPNTFGVFASKKAGIKNVYSMVEGVGDVFVNNSLKWKVIRFVVCHLYKWAFKYSRKVFFLNSDDQKDFIQRKLIKKEKSERIYGIGVDLEYFSYKALKVSKNFLMIARMSKTKGIFEYCECARIVKRKYPDVVFNYLGAERSVKLSDIQEYIDEGSITYLGTTKDVRPYIEDSLLLLLGSYREGMPMSVIEAQSMGRAVIVSNSIGCRDTVMDGYNGFLVEPKDSIAMAEKCIWAIENFERVKEMGKNARVFAEKYFDSQKINVRICEVIFQ